MQVGKAHGHLTLPHTEGSPGRAPRKIHSGSNTQFRLQTLGAGKNSLGAGDGLDAHCCAQYYRGITVLKTHDCPWREGLSCSYIRTCQDLARTNGQPTMIR